jgi:hypothetical protein
LGAQAGAAYHQLARGGIAGLAQRRDDADPDRIVAAVLVDLCDHVLGTFKVV